MEYALIKTVHIATVTLSGLGFVARLLGSLMGAAWVRSRLARTLPHVNDTLLLTSAIGLAVALSVNPLMQPWLMAKILALLAYICLGMVALNPARSGTFRFCSGLAALFVFSYIISVALSKRPGGWLHGLI